MNLVSDQMTENNESYMNTLNAILPTGDPVLDYLANFTTGNSTENLKNADPQEVLETLNLNRQLQADLDKYREEIEAAHQRNIALQVTMGIFFFYHFSRFNIKNYIRRVLGN